jgi:hypothetical protein
MIRYTLNCEHGHSFESWFKSSSAYDNQAKRGLIDCPVCASTKVEKAIMAPRLARSEPAEPAANDAPSVTAPAAPEPMAAMMSSHETELRKKLKELREHVVKNADYVGAKFPEQARKIHYGETEHRSIYGEASPEEAKELYDEGIAFQPLPILPDEFN